MDKNIFNKIYAKYNKKDYFYNKGDIKNRLKEFKILYPDYKVKYSEIKIFLKTRKNKTYNMIKDRILEYNTEIKFYPKSERFTWECIKAINLC